MTSPSLSERFAALTKCVCQGARLMVGFPDYDTYVEHMRRTHPGAAVMTYPEFSASGRTPVTGPMGARGSGAAEAQPSVTALGAGNARSRPATQRWMA